MTVVLDRAIEAPRGLPSEAQDDVARVLLQLVGADDDGKPVILTPEEDAALAVSLAAARRGEFATEAEIQAAWAKRGL